MPVLDNLVLLIAKLSLVFMKTQTSFKYREWKALSKFVGLAQRDLNTPLNFQVYLCSPISRAGLWINHPIVAQPVYSPLEKSSINIIVTLKADVAKHTDAYQEACMKITRLSRTHAQVTHTKLKAHNQSCKKRDINTMAHQQKGRSAHTDERTQQCAWWNMLPLPPHLLLLPALSAKYWLAIKAPQRNLLLCMHANTERLSSPFWELMLESKHRGYLLWKEQSYKYHNFQAIQMIKWYFLGSF